MYYYKRVRDLREDNDKSQSQIAEYLNMKQQQYARYENGIQEIPLHHMVALARYYNVSLDYLAGLTDEPKALNKN
ncbi:MAG: helix-turn-helix transcriptional regulator [Clostridia bacterium]|nr:helix-turn-helix transcriptional regulator [Clostridia bacterium]